MSTTPLIEDTGSGNDSAGNTADPAYIPACVLAYSIILPQSLSVGYASYKLWQKRTEMSYWLFAQTFATTYFAIAIVYGVAAYHEDDTMTALGWAISILLYQFMTLRRFALFRPFLGWYTVTVENALLLWTFLGHLTCFWSTYLSVFLYFEVVVWPEEKANYIYDWDWGGTMAWIIYFTLSDISLAAISIYVLTQRKLDLLSLVLDTNSTQSSSTTKTDLESNPSSKLMKSSKADDIKNTDTFDSNKASVVNGTPAAKITPRQQRAFAVRRKLIFILAAMIFLDLCGIATYTCLFASPWLEYISDALQVWHYCFSTGYMHYTTVLVSI